MGGGQNYNLSQPLTFTAKQDNVKIKLSLKEGSDIQGIISHQTTKTNQLENQINLNYKKNNGSWIKYILGSVIDLNNEDTLSLSGDNEYFNVGIYNSSFGASGSGYYYYKYYNFQITGLVECCGNIQSLINFKDTVDEYAYFGLFANCSGLLTPPILPVSSLIVGCYANMFNGCTSLTSAPQLPATELTNQCYENMFRGCSNLLSVKIDAININYAYCMYTMFSGCSKLSSIEVNFTSWPNVIKAVTDWVRGVASTGQFICPATLPHTTAYFGVSKIPSGWTVIIK